MSASPFQKAMYHSYNVWCAPNLKLPNGLKATLNGLQNAGPVMLLAQKWRYKNRLKGGLQLHLRQNSHYKNSQYTKLFASRASSYIKKICDALLIPGIGENVGLRAIKVDKIALRKSIGSFYLIWFRTAPRNKQFNVVEKRTTVHFLIMMGCYQ